MKSDHASSSSGLGDPPPQGLRTVSVSVSLTISSIESATTDALSVYRLKGEESISAPFCYVLDLVRVAPDGEDAILRDTAVLGQFATVSIAVSEGGNTPMPRRIHGVIDEIRELITTQAGIRRYRIALVPRFARFSLNRQSRVHATASPQTLQTLLANKLTSTGTDHAPEERDNRVTMETDEFRMQIVNDELPRASLSNVAQYDESDLDFIRRQCECHGVHFFFDSDQDDTKDVVVFGNTNSTFADTRTRIHIDLTSIDPNGLVANSDYLPRTSDGPARVVNGSLFSLEHVRRPTPGRFRVIDYNPENPALGLLREYIADSDGEGIHTDHDTHFSTQTEGDRYARIRAQEVQAANSYYLGVTTTPCVVPGRLFDKISTSSGGVKTVESTHLVTHTSVDLTLAHPAITDPSGTPLQTGFRNAFKSVDFHQDEPVFRPPRTTRIPKLPGVYTAHVEPATDTANSAGVARAWIDDEGAYRIAQRFDERNGIEPGKKSMPVRKAEPNAGEDTGFHFPLKTGTEVLISYRNGNPDRPVISGAMPNETHPSPVTGTNRTSNVIVTSSGARFEIDDASEDADAKVTIRNRSGDDASYLRLGKSSVDDATSLEAHYKDTYLSSQEGDGIFLYTPSNIVHAAANEQRTHASEIRNSALTQNLMRGTRIVIYSGDTTFDDAVDPQPPTSDVTRDDEKSLGDEDILIAARGSMYLKADGNLHETSEGNRKEDTGGEMVQTIRHDSREHVWANKFTLVGGSFDTVVLGSRNRVVLGAATMTTVGVSVDLKLAVSVSLFFGDRVLLEGGRSFAVRPALSVMVFGAKVEKIVVAEIKESALEFKSTDLSLARALMDLRESTATVSIGKIATSICGTCVMM